MTKLDLNTLGLESNNGKIYVARIEVHIVDEELFEPF